MISGQIYGNYVASDNRAYPIDPLIAHLVNRLYKDGMVLGDRCLFTIAGGRIATIRFIDFRGF